MESDLYQDREQTAVKHRALKRYLAGAIPIIRTWAKDFCYVDCLAGPWKSVGQELQDTSFALAVSVLREERPRLQARELRPSMRCLFIENDPKSFSQLRDYCGSIKDIDVTPKQWDFESSIQVFGVKHSFRSATIRFPVFVSEISAAVGAVGKVVIPRGFRGISKGGGKRGKPAFGFPRFPSPVFFHSPSAAAIFV